MTCVWVNLLVDAWASKKAATRQSNVAMDTSTVCIPKGYIDSICRN